MEKQFANRKFFEAIRAIMGVAILLLLCSLTVYTFNGHSTITKTAKHLVVSDKRQYHFNYVHPRDPSVVGKTIHITDSRSRNLIDNVLLQIQPVNAQDYANKKPVAIGYITEDHFFEFKVHLPSWLPVFDKIVIYWMDTKSRYRNRHMYNAALEKYPENLKQTFGEKVEIIHVDWEMYPEIAVNLENYSFKTLIWIDAIKRFGFVVFIDSCIKNRPGYDLELLNATNFDDTKPTKACVQFLFERSFERLSTVTHKHMYKYIPYIQQDYGKDAFAKVIQEQSGFMGVMPTAKCLQNYIIPAYFCGLHQDCINPRGSTHEPSPNRHRWDQSIAQALIGNMYGYRKLGRPPPKVKYFYTGGANLLCRGTIKCNVSKDLENFCSEYQPNVTVGTCTSSTV